MAKKPTPPSITDSIKGYQVLLKYSTGRKREQYERKVKELKVAARQQVSVKPAPKTSPRTPVRKPTPPVKKTIASIPVKKPKTPVKPKPTYKQKVVSKLKLSVKEAETKALNDTIKGYRVLFNYAKKKDPKKKEYEIKIAGLIKKVESIGGKPSIIANLDVKPRKNSDALTDLPTQVDISDKKELRRLRNNANARLRRKKKKVEALTKEKKYGWKSRRSEVYKDIVIISRYKNELSKIGKGHVKEPPEFKPPEFNVEKSINHYSYMVWQFEEILRKHIESGEFQEYVFKNSRRSMTQAEGEIDILREYDAVRNASYGTGMSTPIVDIIEDYGKGIITIEVQS